MSLVWVGQSCLGWGNFGPACLFRKKMGKEPVLLINFWMANKSRLGDPTETLTSLKLQDSFSAERKMFKKWAKLSPNYGIENLCNGPDPP